MKHGLLMAFLTAALSSLTIPVSAQTYPAGRRSLSFSDPSRAGRTVTTEMVYPGQTAGTNVPLAGGTEKFPVVVFGHGFVMPVSAYNWLGDSLARYGYIVVLPTTEGTISPNHDQFGRDIAFLCQRIMSLTDSSASFLFGRVTQKAAAGGHSMGGGASFLAITQATAISALFNFAAAETNPSAKAAALTVQRPALLFAGSGDCIVPPATQQEMYNNVPYPCKTFINITGGLHCHFGNNESTCTLGQITSGCNSSSVTASLVFQKVCALLLPFLGHYLKGDCSARTAFETAYTNLSGVSKLRTCVSDPQGCVVTSDPRVNNLNDLKLFPQPVAAGQPLTLTIRSGFIRSVEMYDATGKRVLAERGLLQREHEVHLPVKGTYLIKIQTTNGLQTARIICQ